MDDKKKDGRKRKRKTMYEKLMTGKTTTNQRFTKQQQRSIMNLQIVEQRRRERLKDRNRYGRKLTDIQITILHQCNEQQWSERLKDRNQQ